MLKELNMVNEKFITNIQKTNGILAAWYFGSQMHGHSDQYSDIDIVLLASETSYDAIDKNLSEIFKQICDEVLLCWGEDFNSDAMKNYDYLLKQNDQIFQYDVFLLNHAQMDNFMCKMHYQDLSRENIIFATDGVADMLIQNSPKGNVWHSDIKRIIETYWLNIQMSVKYFKRNDFFKLETVLRTLMDMHASLLLNAYDEITWGGSASKLHYIPKEKQMHLMKYACMDDLQLVRKNLLLSISWFEMDADEIIGDNPTMNDAMKLGGIIKDYWTKQMNED